MCSGAVTLSWEFPQNTIASVAPSMTPPEKPGGIVGGWLSVASDASVVTANGSLISDQLPAESRALTMKVYGVLGLRKEMVCDVPATCPDQSCPFTYMSKRGL